MLGKMTSPPKFIVIFLFNTVLFYFEVKGASAVISEGFHFRFQGRMMSLDLLVEGIISSFDSG
jgi:hypothetical protein